MRVKPCILKSCWRCSRYTEFLKELESDEMQNFWGCVSSMTAKLTSLERRVSSACKKLDTLFPDVDKDSKAWFSADIRYLRDGVVTNVTLDDGTIRTEFKPYKEPKMYDKKD